MNCFCEDYQEYQECTSSASLKTNFWACFFLKVNSANWFCQNNRGSQGDNEKGVGGGVGGGWSVDHTIITKSRLLLLQQSGFKGRPGKVSLKSCNHCNNGWNKKLIGPTHLTIWPKKQKTVVILKMFPLKPLTCYCRYWSTWPDLTEPWGAPQEAGELGNI